MKPSMLRATGAWFRQSLVICLLALVARDAAAKEKGRPRATPWERPVPRAECGRHDRTETALQGQTTLAERLLGASMEAYNCNLELVSEVPEQGAEWQVAWFDDCAYFDTYNNPLKARPGTVVVDLSNTRKPEVSEYLTSRAMIDPWESLKVNPARKLLGATKGPGFGASGPTDKQFAFYDVSGDCKHPRLLSDVNVPEHTGHAGDFAPDGRTYYGTGGGGFTAMDIDDPSNPKLIGRFQRQTHDISISEDGNRAYLAQQGNFVPFGAARPNGLVILDVSDVQARRPNPQVRQISSFFWPDGGVAQQTMPVTINRRPHLIFTDETGVGLLPTPGASRVEACKQGLAMFGYARIIDITDETNPRLVSKLMLEVSDPANCEQVLPDFPPQTSDFENYGYSSHYCDVDDVREPKMLACTYWGAGLRVFDISDAFHPREVAYYKPPAQRTKFLPGSGVWNDYRGNDRTTDRVGSRVRFYKHRGETQLWFSAQDNGLQIVRFTKPVGQLLRKDGDRHHEEDD